MRAIQDWSSKHGWHFHILDYAMHFDESTPHVHYSPLMDVKDKDGHFIIAQEKALREAGIELPDPSKPEGRYNNRKKGIGKTPIPLFCSSCLQCRSNLFFFFDLNRLDTLIANFDLLFLFAF